MIGIVVIVVVIVVVVVVVVVIVIVVVVVYSLLTQLGPTDYWSRQLAQYNNGESHRTVFNETMEKIYNRLYHRSKQ